MVRAEGLAKRFGEVQALTDVGLELGAGRITVMLGRNGAGKSTLVRILGTRLIPDSGTVEVAGADAARQGPEVRRRTGVVLPDERSWYWPLTGRKNLEFFARLSELGRRAAQARVSELLAEVALTEAADRPVAGYSSGMRARLAMARALLLDPPVLLLDEPTRALDPGISRDLQQRVLGRAHARGTAVLWVTHDLHEAAVVADDVVVLDGGRLVHHGGRPAAAEELADLLETL